jgi:hypothetical protein
MYWETASGLVWLDIGLNTRDETWRRAGAKFWRTLLYAEELGFYHGGYGGTTEAGQ